MNGFSLTVNEELLGEYPILQSEFFYNRRMFLILNNILKPTLQKILSTENICFSHLAQYMLLISEYNQLDTFSIPNGFNDYKGLTKSSLRIQEFKEYTPKREINDYIILKNYSMAKTLRSLIEENTLLLGPWLETMEVEKNGLLTQIFKDEFFKSCPFQHPHYPGLEYSQKLNMKVIEEYYKKDRKICLFWPINGCSLDDSLDPGFKHLSFGRNYNLETFKLKFKMFLIRIMKFYYHLSYPEKLILACVFQQSIGLYINLPKTHSIFKKITGKKSRTSISGVKAPNRSWRTADSSTAYLPPHRRKGRSKMKGGGRFKNYQVNVIDKLGGVNNVNCILGDRIFFTHEIADLEKNHGNRNRIYPTFRLENGNLIPIPNITALEFIEAHRLSNGNFYRSLYFFELLIFVSEDEDVFKDNPEFIKLSSKIIVRKSTNKACIMLCDENLEDELMWKLLEEDNSDLINLIYEKLEDESILTKLKTIKQVKKIIKELIDVRHTYEKNTRVKNKYFTQLISRLNRSEDLESNTNTRNTISSSNNTSFGNFNKKKKKSKSKKTQNTGIGSKSQRKQQSTQQSSISLLKSQGKRNKYTESQYNSDTESQRQLQSSNNSSNTRSKRHKKPQSFDNSSTNSSNARLKSQGKRNKYTESQHNSDTESQYNSDTESQRQLQSSNNSSNTRSKRHKKPQSFDNSSTNSSNARLKSQGKRNKYTESQHNSDTESQHNSDTESQYNSVSESQHNSDTESQGKRIKYKNRLYKVHVGPNGGKYIITNKSKKYI